MAYIHKCVVHTIYIYDESMWKTFGLVVIEVENHVSHVS